MWDIATIKERGRVAFKRNYWPSVAMAFVMSLLTMGSGAAYSTSGGGGTTTITVNGTPISDEQMAMIAAAAMAAAIIITVVSILLRIFLFNPIEVGGRRFFKKNINDPSTPFGTVAEGFGDYGRVFITMFLRDLFIALFTLLLIIPGIMKAYSYRMVPYIVRDHPELAPMDVLARSSQMMQGNRWRAFLMDLSFIGWIVLGVVSLGIVNIFWTSPYMQSTDAALYLELSGERG